MWGEVDGRTVTAVLSMAASDGEISGYLVLFRFISFVSIHTGMYNFYNPLSYFYLNKKSRLSFVFSLGEAIHVH